MAAPFVETKGQHQGNRPQDVGPLADKNRGEEI
jgi:hypothetical protein